MVDSLKTKRYSMFRKRLHFVDEKICFDMTRARKVRSSVTLADCAWQIKKQVFFLILSETGFIKIAKERIDIG